jgi:hypothetical protein
LDNVMYERISIINNMLDILRQCVASGLKDQ